MPKPTMEDLSEDDRNYLEQHRRAFQRQSEAQKIAEKIAAASASVRQPPKASSSPLPRKTGRGDDEDRKRAAQEHMKAVQSAQMSVADIDPYVQLPEPVAQPVVQPAMHPSAHQAVRTGANISIMVAIPEDSGAIRTSAPVAGEKFAPDWTSMKDIVTKYDGTWIVTRYEFSSSVQSILGFFRKDGWSFPEGSQREQFEVIVKNGRAFRTDPE